MIIEVKIPSPGESISEVEISSLMVKNGEYINENQLIAEIDSDKATLEIRSEKSGIVKLMAKKGEKIKVGDTLCLIDTSNNKKNQTKKSETIINQLKNDLKNDKKNFIPFASPASKKILREEKLSIEKITGTGKKGRITKKDCFDQIKKINYNKHNENKREEIKIPLSNLRKKLSERLVSIKNKAAILTTFNEINLQEIFFIRKKYKNFFKKKHGVNLGFMSFFTLACVKALKMYPDINSMIQENNKISFNYIDISIAMSGPKGLVVPVLRNVENYSFKDIEKKIKFLSEKVRNNTITINEMKGGTFTITNGGVFGSMLSTPIINPPQSAILGMHKIMERVIVINGNIKIRPMMYVALSYDHRIIDGRESVGFLSSIKEFLEDPIQFLIDGENNINKKLDLL